jgi:hypothetical protein
MPMLDSTPHDERVPILARLADKWRFIVIMIANVWLVFLIMRFGLAWQQPEQTPEGQPPVAEYGLTTTLIASFALVATVLALTTGVFLSWRHRSHRPTRLAVYLGEDVPHSVDDHRK